MTENERETFKKLKSVCVPLLGASLLTPAAIPNVLQLLKDLAKLLDDIHASGAQFSPAQISYIFFPISGILRRNQPSSIPDQVFERIFHVLRILCEDWWWFLGVEVWEQIFMLCGAVIGGIEAKGKGKQRDEETKEAAARCLLSLLRVRDDSVEATSRLATFQEHARSQKFVPILGQTFDAVLTLTQSHRIALQTASLDLLCLLMETYLPDYLLPSILPGVVSSMTKLALGSTGSKSWQKGDTVANSLRVIQIVVVTSIGDEVCKRDGAIHVVQDLEDLLSLSNEQPKPPQTDDDDPVPYATKRTPAWLRGTATQLHIALNSLTPLVKHPTPSALTALATFSAKVLAETASTLPQSQALLLSFLLTLSVSEYPNVSKAAKDGLHTLLTTTSTTQASLLQTLMQHTRDSLSILPRFLSSQADEKVEHIAGQIEAICHLAAEGKSTSLRGITHEIAKLFGPTGGIEKWGWSLLSVLQFVNPPVITSGGSSAQWLLESDSSSTQTVSFPELTLKNVSTRSTYDALIKMFHAMGLAAGDACLPAVEWFTGVGQAGTGGRAVAALWCACQLLQGSVHLDMASPGEVDILRHPRSKTMEKFVRELAKSIARLWEGFDSTLTPEPETTSEGQTLEVTVVKGVENLQDTLKILHPASVKPAQSMTQPMLHQAIALQLLATIAGVLQARFTSLFLYTLYPVLRSLVSRISYLSSTAFATLSFITVSTSYASPANLLVSNFDYVLDGVSRRLTRRWLDVDATKVLIIIVHIIGDDVVARAGDIVEECFDRLDEYHGYTVIVDGLVEVLGEIVKVVKTESDADRKETNHGWTSRRELDQKQFDAFLEWMRTKDVVPKAEDDTDYGPAPRQAWADLKEDTEKEENPGIQAEDQEKGDEVPLTGPQSLTSQIVSRSIYFLTHGSPTIRARILTLLASSVSVLNDSALMPSVHSAWPFVLNRLADPEGFVVSSAAALIEALATHHGDYMFRRIWDDVWPRFYKMLGQLDQADRSSALARRDRAGVGTESAYTHSHRLYRSLLRTMTAAASSVHPRDSSVWQVITAFRRFLHSEAHDELQHLARTLYVELGKNNADAVWLALHSTSSDLSPTMRFLRQEKWDIALNVEQICSVLDA